jgi:hypothetical protein
MVELPIAYHPAGPIEIHPVPQNELHLIPVREMVQIGPKVFAVLTRPGALQVHDLMGPRIERTHVNGPGRFDENRESSLQEFGGEVEGVRVDERLPSGDLHQPTPDLFDPPDDVGDEDLLPAVKGVLGVAPHAS